ncbi:hypothetical protein SAMN05216600_104222 [Pseudomonas cuatrocienegasensis]|uniref:Uncharacterized protein n=1 Tax=Pseudomonas cuatrocienegasensis TaxID=543360 RepID=A0ABY1B914_9PSED|nr:MULTISPECIES: hypothetical protein [Pseudomonas]OEC35686.1 hypothetical protein A7D25_07645 [Pseudomonas sp. 21C1]SEQ24815.1 hypothetical protein SAMN05216600_104222 [Pseudomonas cuatrocienegasensis]
MNFNAWFETWPLDLQIACLLAPFVISLSGVFIIIVMGFRNLDVILATFPNSEYVKRQKVMWGGSSLPSRFILTSSLAAVALWPNNYIKRGELDENEVKKLPNSIKRRMIVAWWLCVIGMAWLFLLIGLLKLSGVE